MIDHTGLLPVALGLLLVLFHRRFGIACVKSQNAVWGLQYGEKEVKGCQIAALVLGFLFMAVGMLTLVGVLHDKP